MKEAIQDTVKPGCNLYIEGFTHLICFAAGHEIIRQGIGNLTATRLTPDLVYDQLIEAGLVKKLIFRLGQGIQVLGACTRCDTVSKGFCNQT